MKTVKSGKPRKAVTMNIVIKNVTGEPVNEGLISELSRAGFPAGSVVYDAVCSSGNKSCILSSGDYDCIAYIGETCERLPRRKRVLTGKIALPHNNSKKIKSLTK